MPAIHDAAKKGDLQEVLRLLSNGTDVNAEDDVSDLICLLACAPKTFAQHQISNPLSF